MRQRVIAVLVLGAVLAVAMAAVATAKWTVFQVGNLILKTEGKVMPTALPRHELAPSSFQTRGRIETADGTHPPALREGVIYFDESGELDARGLPVCAGGQLEARNTKGAKKACGDSIIGEGTGVAEIAFPEQKPIRVTSPLTIFNGGIQNGTTTMFIHAFITVPVPAAIVAVFEFRRVDVGPYGTRGVFKIPVIAGGSGSTVGFDFKIKRFYNYRGKRKSYDLSSCPDGRISVKGEGIFKDEVGDGEKTTIGGALILPCTPKE
jgi:hypothetical protein